MLCSYHSLLDLLFECAASKGFKQHKVKHVFNALGCYSVGPACYECAIKFQCACTDFQRGIVAVRAFLLPQVEMMKSLCMDCSNVSFLASDLLLDLSTFNQFFFFFVWNRFSSSTWASDVVNRKSGGGGQHTKLSTSLCCYKCRLKFAHFCITTFWSNEVSLLSNAQQGFCLRSFL